MSREWWKKARVSCTIEYDIEVPNDWTEEDVDFHRNESSRCASNLLDELKSLGKDHQCMCQDVSFTCLNIESQPKWTNDTNPKLTN